MWYALWKRLCHFFPWMGHRAMHSRKRMTCMVSNNHWANFIQKVVVIICGAISGCSVSRLLAKRGRCSCFPWPWVNTAQIVDSLTMNKPLEFEIIGWMLWLQSEGNLKFITQEGGTEIGRCQWSPIEPLPASSPPLASCEVEEECDSFQTKDNRDNLVFVKTLHGHQPDKFQLQSVQVVVGHVKTWQGVRQLFPLLLSKQKPTFHSCDPASPGVLPRLPIVLSFQNKTFLGPSECRKCFLRLVVNRGSLSLLFLHFFTAVYGDEDLCGMTADCPSGREVSGAKPRLDLINEQIEVSVRSLFRRIQ